MATGSAATKRHQAQLRLVAAGYTTHIGPAEPRCDTCVASRAHPGLIGKSRHDLWCKQHGAGVKTHGCCQRHPDIGPAPSTPECPGEARNAVPERPKKASGCEGGPATAVGLRTPAC